MLIAQGLPSKKYIFQEENGNLSLALPTYFSSTKVVENQRRSYSQHSYGYPKEAKTFHQNQRVWKSSIFRLVLAVVFKNSCLGPFNFWQIFIHCLQDNVNSYRLPSGKHFLGHQMEIIEMNSKYYLMKAK
jgi:hypothetical protein